MKLITCSSIAKRLGLSGCSHIPRDMRLQINANPVKMFASDSDGKHKREQWCVKVLMTLFVKVSIFLLKTWKN